MNFVELSFWFILFSGLGIIAAVRTLAAVLKKPWPLQGDLCLLGILNLVLLFNVNLTTFCVFCALLVLSYGYVTLTSRNRYWRKPFWVLAAFFLLLSPLLFFKYGAFIGEDFFQLDVTSISQIVIPAGISFYTFQMIALILDTRDQNLSAPGFLPYLNFVGFFPQIVAGPIERRQSLLPQIEAFRFKFRVEDFRAGGEWVILGLFYKLVLSDNYDGFIDRNAYDGALVIWLMNLLFGMKIYFDFCGYSLIALGLGRCLGVRLTLNFSAPYFASNIQDFWRRWHISLSSWFKDYLYIPMGGSRVRWWVVNLMVVFVVSGIWHGAGWNFILWGFLHGLGCVVVHFLGHRVNLPGFVSWLATLLFVFFTWLAFYELRGDVLFQKYVSLLSPGDYGVASLVDYFKAVGGGNLITLASLIFISGLVLACEWLGVRRDGDPYIILRKPVFTCLQVMVIFWLGSVEQSQFIYFSF